MAKRSKKRTSKKSSKKSPKRSGSKRKPARKIAKKRTKLVRRGAVRVIPIQREYVVVGEKRPGLGRGMAEGAAAGFGIAAGHELGEWVFD